MLHSPNVVVHSPKQGGRSVQPKMGCWCPAQNGVVHSPKQDDGAQFKEGDVQPKMGWYTALNRMMVHSPKWDAGA